MRFFNTAGPIVPEMHYCVPPLERLEADEVLLLIRHMYARVVDRTPLSHATARLDDLPAPGRPSS